MDAPGGSADGHCASLIPGQLMEVYNGEFAGGESSMASFGTLGMRAACPFEAMVPKTWDVICDGRCCPLIFLDPCYDCSRVDPRDGVPGSVLQSVPLCDAWPKVTRRPSCGDKAVGGSVDHPFDVAWREANLRW